MFQADPDPSSLSQSHHSDSQAQYTVAQITQHIKERFESDALLQDVWVQGEISNWNRSRSGHCYLTLKDSEAAIRAVIWRTLADRLVFRPQDGQFVLAHGRVSVYEPQGQYQLYVDRLQPMGQGALYLEFEALKTRLAAEGLFDSDRKRQLPVWPDSIGVVTSPTAAALRDVLNVLGRRWPLAQVLLSPTLVQGTNAPSQIIAALETLYHRNDIDLIIITRGGGSIEDLWAFNDERLARTIARSPVPVISGIGHEIDFTIADFVADVRAPTPSAAAEIAVPDQIEARGQLMALSMALTQITRQRIGDLDRELNVTRQRLTSLSPAAHIEQGRQRIDDLVRRQDRALRHTLTLNNTQLAGLARRLEGLNPYATLDRGYAIVRDQDGQIVFKTKQAVPGKPLQVRVSDGTFSARVES